MGSQSLPLNVRHGERKREETAAGNKTEKEEKKRSCWNPGKKTEPEENNKIKPADLPHIQTNAVTTRQKGARTLHTGTFTGTFFTHLNEARVGLGHSSTSLHSSRKTHNKWWQFLKNLLALSLALISSQFVASRVRCQRLLNRPYRQKQF